jgi:hypothetical protein
MTQLYASKASSKAVIYPTRLESDMLDTLKKDLICQHGQPFV